MHKIIDSTKFLLKNATSIELYEKFAKDLPIVDYHCHLKPDEIYKDKKFRNITELWLEKDHYKWRLMRANGIEEARVTGAASDKEKFLAWAETIERCPGNPLYHWTHMELRNFFGIEETLNRNTAEAIWQQTNEQLGETGWGARNFITSSRVSIIGTTDDPLSDLAYHKKLAAEPVKAFRVIPTLRIEKLLKVDDPRLFDEIDRNFQEQCDTLIEYLAFIRKRIHFFSNQGGRSADLGVATVDWEEITTDPVETFSKLRARKSVSVKEMCDVKTYLLIEMMVMFYEVDWVFQLHYGAAGSVNNEARLRLGQGTGFDSIIDQGNVAKSILFLLNQVNDRGSLPKTILYNIDGSKNVVTETIMACFQDNETGIRGKLQHGPAWWFQDTLRGNRRQLEDLAEQGILMNFIGMTTDSRSFLSYVRHDYFRRILCDCLGNWIEAGEMPYDRELLKTLIESICYKNAQEYFGMVQLT